MGIRDSFSRLKEKLELRSTGRRRKPDDMGFGTDEEGVGPADSLPRPELYVAAGGVHGREGGRSNADGQQVHSTGWLPRPDKPESVLNEREVGGGAGVEGGEVSQSYSHPRTDVGVVVGGGSGRGGDADKEGGDHFHSRLSTPSTPRSENPDANMGTSIILDGVPGVLPPGESDKLRTTNNENEVDGKPTTSITAKLLYGVRDSASGFGLLRTIAGTLCSILENTKQTEVDIQAIELLAPRIKVLSESLCAPIHLGDINEKERGERLEQKLEDICQSLTLSVEQGDLRGFLTNHKDMQNVNCLLEDVHEAVMDYQMSLQQDIYVEGCQLIEPVDLTLLEKMGHTTDASYHCGNRQGCLKGTRKGVLWEIEHWSMDKQKQHVFWLNGLAGTGKSTIAQTFAERMFADGRLGASFFCSRDFEDRSNLQAIFPTLAYQLALQYPPFRKKLLQVLKAHPNARQESLCSQMEKFIVGPLKAAHISTLIIIDALDECRDSEPASAILSILSRCVNEIPDVKFFITGRPEPRIRSGFRLRSLLPITEVLKLHEVKPEAVNNDIKLFFQTQLTDLAESRSDCDCPGDWPSQFDIEILCKKAAGFFIYAVTVVKFVASENHLPTERLTIITSLPQTTIEEGKSGVDQLYTSILRHAFHNIQHDDIQFYTHLRSILGTVLLISNPLSIKGLSDLLKRPHTSQPILSTIRSLHSVLLVPDNMEDPILTFHKSFPDFLTDSKRCKDSLFFVEPAVHHVEILLSCLNLMSERLKKNICGLDDYAVLSTVQDLPNCQKGHIGDALGYACCYWTKHLLRIPCNTPEIKEVQKAIEKFSTTHLLFWIEVLSLMGNLGVGVYALNDIEQWYTMAGSFCKWANDSQRFLLEHFDIICHSPSHVYHSALPFSPPSSWLHKCYSAELSGEVKIAKGIPAEWGSCLRTVTLLSTVTDLACQKDTVAVGLDSGEIVTLDGTTGSQKGVLSGHTSQVNSLTFSSDGTLLVSGSYKTIKLWDVQTGGVVKTFQGHISCGHSVSISADSTTIASGSDGTIMLWNIETGECHHITEQQEMVECVIFSPIHSQYLISVSGGKVQQWDIDGHQINPPHDGSCATFSSDGAQLVLCQGADIVVQNSGSGTNVAKFHAPGSTVTSCCFSPDGKFVAVAAEDRNVYIWDITGSNPHLVETIVGDSLWITYLVFSSPSSLITSSWGKTIKFWEIATPLAHLVVDHPKSIPSTSTLIKSINLQAKNGIFVSCDLGGMVKTWDISTGLCKTSLQTPAKNVHHSDVRLVNDRLTLVWHADEKIHVWDVEGEKLLHEIGVLWSEIDDIKISGDGSKVFCIDFRSIHAFSTLTGEIVGQIESDVAFTQKSLLVNDSRVWVHSPYSPVYGGWDFGTMGSSPIELVNLSPSFNLSDTKIWDFGLSGIKDRTTGKVVLKLGVRFANPFNVQLDGQYFLAYYQTGEVLILDFNDVLLW